MFIFISTAVLVLVALTLDAVVVVFGEEDTVALLIEANLRYIGVGFDLDIGITRVDPRPNHRGVGGSAGIVTEADVSGTSIMVMTTRRQRTPCLCI